MNLSLSKVDLCSYYSQLLNNLFPDNSIISKVDIDKIIDTSLDRLNHCFKHVAFDRYNNDAGTIYNHLYADHNIVFNWFLANTSYRVSGNKNLSTKLYYLNKIMHSFDCMYDTELPDIFLVFHGAGTMLGKAKYDDFFVVLQGCTVGSQKGEYPEFGKGVSLTANSSVIGKCTIGNRVSISVHTLIFSKKIPDDSTVFINGDSGRMEIKLTKECYAQQFFNLDLRKF